MIERQARAAILDLLGERAAGATICPSEAARRLGGAHWRKAMDVVHGAAARMAAEGRVRLSWKGASRQVADGPYRIGRIEPEGGG